MVSYSDLDPSKKAFVFELDDVLFPEKDYLLQVYYLFAGFLEFTETFPPAGDLVNFMKKVYENSGSGQIFQKAQEVFGIDAKYEENFNRLHTEAKLPLKLLLFKDALTLLQDIVVDRKQLYIVTGGDPGIQLNKIRQMEWNGLENYLRVYFADEISPMPSPDTLNLILGKYGLSAPEVLCIGRSETGSLAAQEAGIDFVRIN